MTGPTAQATGLTFTVLDVVPEPYAAVPILTARISVTAPDDEPVHAIALRCQVRIEPLRRGYSDEEAVGLTDLFGPRERWATTQRTFLWQHCAAMVPAFVGATEITLSLECTYDFEVAAAKYLHALLDGTCHCNSSSAEHIHGRPARILRSAGVMGLRGPIDMPVTAWRDLIRQHFPNTGWVRLPHDTVAALAAYKSTRGLLSIEDAVTALLDAAPRMRDDRRLGPGPGRRRRRPVRGLLAIPVPRDLEQEPIALAVGRFGPAGAADAGIGEDDTLAAQFLVDGAKALTLVVRFLQLQHRRTERDAGGGRFEPVDELTTPTGSWLTWTKRPGGGVVRSFAV